MFISSFVFYEKVCDYLLVVDVVFILVKLFFSKKYCILIKDGEYWVLGLFVVIIRDILDDFDLIDVYNVGYVL